MMMLYLLIALQVKHFVCDFPLQGPYQYLNKGTYGHAGGLLHSFIHQVGTLCVFLILIPRPASTEALTIRIAVILFVEFLAHYHIDWAKMNINKHMNWKPNTSEQFWWLLGFDQLLHQLTYVWMIWMVMS